MGGWEEKAPTIAMVLLQCVYAAMALMNRAALVKGMSPWVFIFYRQAIATLVISPVAYFTRDKSSNSTSCMELRSFLLISLTAFIGVVMNQTTYFEGLYLASSSIASAMSNLVPALTFLIAAIVGLEQVNMKKLSSIAKILGTAFCVGGAASMALLRGPKLLNNAAQPPSDSLVLHSLGGETWLLGCLFLFVSSCCWSLWLILQVPVTARCPNHLSQSAWMCFLSMLQSGMIALYIERDPNAWNLSSGLELTCCLFSGIVGSGIQLLVQSWCISRRGPLFSALFNPLCTVITTVVACIFLQEQLYLGRFKPNAKNLIKWREYNTTHLNLCESVLKIRLLGGVTVIIGLYIVLWGKGRETKSKIVADIEDCPPKTTIQEKVSCTIIDLEQPLLIDNSVAIN